MFIPVFQLPSIPNSVTVSATGSGIALVEVGVVVIIVVVVVVFILHSRSAGPRSVLYCYARSLKTWLRIDDRLYSAILRSLEQTHCARM